MGGCVSCGDCMFAPCSCLVFPPGHSTSACCLLGVPPWGYNPCLCKPCCNCGRFEQLRADPTLSWVPICGSTHCMALAGCCGCALAVPTISRQPPASSPPRFSVLFAHGNGQDLEFMRTQVLDYLSPRLRTPCNLIAFEYPGYSLSNLPTGEALVLRAAEAVYSDVCRHMPEERIVLYGISLGTGVVTNVAARHSPGAVILQSPYTSIAGAVLPTEIAQLVPCCDLFHVLRQAPNVTCPVQMLHGEADRVVPARCTRELEPHFPDCRPPLLVPGAGHNDLLWVLQDRPTGDEWTELIDEVLTDLDAALDRAGGPPPGPGDAAVGLGAHAAAASPGSRAGQASPRPASTRGSPLRSPCTHSPRVPSGLSEEMGVEMGRCLLAVPTAPEEGSV
eukprot:TRINITY_DN10105_c0_g1_i2.p1 TRINITY_DN10105_c0_g1~~TRINITY_DN10105_c0_g1_i2.p1  ORF type:complete len:422 (+),score=87.49 TRINITY_DN10105_c0_g1_i2:95-1267(+)